MGQEAKEVWLTIAIPTYNRQEKARLICDLISGQAQKHPHVQIQVIDNCSEPPVYNEKAGFPAGVSYCRNAANFGLSGSILRAFEICSGTYLWFLCDDDELKGDALDMVLEALAEPVDLVNFSSHRPYPEKRLLPGSEIVQAMHYANMAFIPACVFRVDAFRQYLGFGYRYANTLVPHLAMAIRCALDQGDGFRLLLHPGSPVVWTGGADNWNQLYYLENVYLLGDVALTSENRRSIINKASSIVHPRDAAAALGSEFLRRPEPVIERFKTVLRMSLCSYQASTLRLKLLWCLYGGVVAISTLNGLKLLRFISNKRGKIFLVESHRPKHDRV